jgi:hypothetical protein
VGVVIKVCESQAKSVRKANPPQRRTEETQREEMQRVTEKEKIRRREERENTLFSFFPPRFLSGSASLRCIGFSTSK